MPTKNLTHWGIIILPLFLLLILTIPTLAASPPVDTRQGATPTPTVTPTPTPEYWVGDTIFWSGYGAGVDTAGLGDITVPDDNNGVGYIIYVNEDGYSSDGNDQVIIQSPGNNINSLHDIVGVTECLDDLGGVACSAVGFPYVGWADGFSGTTTYSLWFQDTGDGTVTFSVKPVYYGVKDAGEDCEDTDPSLNPVIGESCLLGTDNSGDSYVLEPNVIYQLVIADDSGWNDGSSERYDMGISFDGGSTWMAAQMLPNLNEDTTENCASEEDYQKTAIDIVVTEETTMQLRANDADGEFGDNSGDLCYTLYNGGTAVGGAGSCGYSLSTDPISGSADSRDSTGSKMIAPWTPDESMAIEIGPPDWNIGGEMSTEVDVKDAELGQTAIWYHLRDYTGVFCIEEWAADHFVYYLDMPAFYNEDTSYYIRAHDPDGDWEHNWGYINYTQYVATETSQTTDCELIYDVGGFLDSVDVQSWNRMYGYELDLGDSTSSTYMLQSSGGPVTEGGSILGGGSEYYGLEVSTDHATTWVDLDEFADCISQAGNHHYKYYFELDDYSRGLWVRYDEQSGDWLDNDGSTQVSLYGASDISGSVGDDCSELFYLDSKVEDKSVSATNESGVRAYSIIEEGEYYAIEQSTGGWGIPSTSSQLEIKGSGTWHDLADWSAVLCAEVQPNGLDRVYIKAGGNAPTIRVADPDGDWSNNVGSADWDIKAVDYLGPDMNLQCESAYSNMYSQLKGTYEIPPKMEFGTGDNLEILEGGIYSIESHDGPWFEGNEHASYSLEISDDGGVSWSSFEASNSPCIVPAGDGGRYLRVYIDAASNDYRVRVKDTNGNFFDNSGSISVTLTEYREEPFPHENVPMVDVPGGLFNGCGTICLRPDSYLKVGQWIRYAYCSFSRYVSWCPYHNEMISSMPELFRNREPIATFYELSDSINTVKNEVDSYQWNEDTGGAGAPTVTQPENFIFGSDQGGAGQSPFAGTGPYSGEPIEFDTSASYSDNCISLLAEHMGTLMTPGICFATNALSQLGLTSWFQFFWDVSMLLALLGYTYTRWFNAFAQ